MASLAFSSPSEESELRSFLIWPEGLMACRLQRGVKVSICVKSMSSNRAVGFSTICRGSHSGSST